MDISNRTEVRRMHEALCEEIFSAWMAGALASARLSHGLSVEHCPEPYLDFSTGDPGIVWVTHNPGRGEDFQQRAAVGTAASPLVGDLSYAENARLLADWYAGHGSLSISSAARSRIASMLRLGADLGMPGLRQVELFPLHSEKRPPDAFLFGTPAIDEPLRSYGELARALIATSPVVIGLCGSPPVRSGRAVSDWSRALQLDLDAADCLPLSVGRASPTVGLFIGRSDSRVAVLFCRQGSNGLPSAKVMPQVVAALGEALR